jgi:hypothetical protein
MSDTLFVMRVRLSGGTAIIRVWDAGRQEPNHTRLDCELRWNGVAVFPRGAAWCGVAGQHSIDGNAARSLVLSLFAMRPGDTDAEYFDSYTPEQLAWATEHGEELSWESQARYCDENGDVQR